MIFVNDRGFSTLGSRTDIYWEDLLQQHHITVGDCSVVLIVSLGRLKPYKGYWYPIQWLWKDYNTSMISYDNA